MAMPDPEYYQFWVREEAYAECLEWLESQDRPDAWRCSPCQFGEADDWAEGYEFTFTDLGFGTLFKFAFSEQFVATFTLQNTIDPSTPDDETPSTTD